MRRMPPEPCEVWLSDGRPVRFGWRGRLYTVLAIVERPPPGAYPAVERCWRVNASPGPGIPAAPYRLCQQPVPDRWLLTRDSA